jgi:hypothetical protein
VLAVIVLITTFLAGVAVGRWSKHTAPETPRSGVQASRA